MQVIIKKKINEVEEAFALLFYYINTGTFDKIKSEAVRMNAAGDSDRFHKTMNLIEKINNYVTDNMRFDKGRLEFYFKKLGDANISLVHYLLPLFPDINHNSLSDYENAARNKSEKDIWKDFKYILTEEYAMGGVTKKDKPISSFEEVVQLIDQEESLSSEDRWKIVQAYLKHDQLLSEICDILKRTIQLIKECQSAVDELMEDFYGYWSDFSKNHDLLKELQKRSKISWEYNEEGTYVVPSIFFSQSIIYSINDKEEKKADIIHLGVLIDSNFTVKNAAADVSDINNSLKLLSDKSKFDILMYIKDKPSYGLEIANALNLSTSTISYHMSSLERAHLVRLEKDANKIYFSVDHDAVNQLLDNIKSILL